MQGLKEHYFRFISNKLLIGFKAQHIDKQFPWDAEAAVLS